MNLSIQQALHYQSRNKLTVAEIHPELRFTRLGAILREHATADDDVGALAHSALTSDHSEDLDLMPLHLLKDKMQEQPDHPLAKEFNWERVPEGVQADQALRRTYGNALLGDVSSYIDRILESPEWKDLQKQHPILRSPVGKGTGLSASIVRLTGQYQDGNNYSNEPEEGMNFVKRLSRPSHRY